MKNPDQFAEPLGEAVGELQFENNLLIKARYRVLHFSLDAEIEVWFGLHCAIHGYANFVVIADVRFPHVKNMNARLSVNFSHEIAEPLDGHELVGAFRYQMLRLRKMVAQQESHAILP